jgi:tetratricopeptide (TPR) repeat protein
MATVFLKIGALAQATEYFDSACRFGGDPNAYIQLGYVNFIRGNIEIARNQFQSAIRDGNLVFAANYLLGLLERSQGRVESARQYFTNAVEQAVASFREESPDANLLGYHALSLAALGKSEESHSILKRIKELGEMDGEIMLLVARTLAVLGSRAEAESCVRRAMEAYAGPTVAELEFDPHFVGCRADERHLPPIV